MVNPSSSEHIRWTTRLASEGHNGSITPKVLGRERSLITPNWLWSPEPIKGAYGQLDFGAGRMANKTRRKVEALITGLGVSGVSTHESLIYELRQAKSEGLYPQGAYGGITYGDALEHVLISGEPRDVLADKPERMSIVFGGCNGSNKGTIATTPDGWAPFQFGGEGGEHDPDEYIVSVGFTPWTCLYEENVARLSTTFAGNMMARAPEDIRFSVVNDVPWRGYWLYLLRHLQHNKTSVAAFRRWREEVNARSRSGRDHHAELLRGVLGDRAGCEEIIDVDEFEPLDEILMNLEPGAGAPQLQDLVDIMRSSGDPLWNLTLDPDLRQKVKYKSAFLSPEVRTVQELCGNSYVVAVLRRMLLGPVMSVNDYVEQTIEAFVQEWTSVLTEHAGLTFQGGSFAVYPFSHIVPQGEGQVLYRADPGRILLVDDRLGISGYRHGEWVDAVTLLPGSYRS